MHSTHRPLLWIAVCLSLGIILGRYCLQTFAMAAGLTMITLSLSGILCRRSFASTVFLLLSFVFLGSVLFVHARILPRYHLLEVAKYYRGVPVFVKGVVASDVQTRKAFKGQKTVFELDVRQFKTRWGWKKKNGRILVNLFRKDTITYGEELYIEGKLYEPFDFSDNKKFSYRDYLNNKGIYLILSVKKDGTVKALGVNKGNPVKAFSYRVRNRCRTILKQYLTPNEAGLMQAILLGDRTGIPPHIRELFIQTGTAHVLAISGLHIGIIAFLLFLLFKIMPLKRPYHYILTIVFLVFYAFLTGGRPSVVRATIMACVFLLGFLFGKEAESINSLSLAAIILLLANPMNVWDIGFQLSFASVFAIIYCYPWAWRKLAAKEQIIRNKTLRFIVQSALVSLIAWLSVAGLIAYYFDIVTPVTVLANLLTIPFITLVIALGLGLLFTGAVFPVSAFLFANCIKIILNLMVGSIYIMSRIPGAYFYVKGFSLNSTWAYYIFIVLLVYMGRNVVKLTK